MTAKKTAPAKKAAAKTSAAKSSEEKTEASEAPQEPDSDKNKDETPAAPVDVPSSVEDQPAEELPKTKNVRKMSVSKVAEMLLDNSRQWGTGRDRDINLANEGYDLEEIRREMSVQRGKRLEKD